MEDRDNTQDAAAYPQQALELSILLARTWSALTRMQALELAPYNITPEQASVLHILTSVGGLATYNRMARLAVRQYRSMASLINRMSLMGLVKKNPVASKNKYEISLTEKGTELYERLPRSSANALFSCLSPQQRRDFSKSLQILLDHGCLILGLDYVPPYLESINDAHPTDDLLG
jgi:DNA-binding MarR family transcriptional regulator